MDSKQLIKDWIQYLKNNQIVALQSDPKSGKLKYNRPVSADDITKFLETKTDYSADEISYVIDQVISKKGSTPDTSDNKTFPPPAPSTPAPSQPSQDSKDNFMGNRIESPMPKRKYNYDDVTDIEPKYKTTDTTPRALPAPRKREKDNELLRLKEAIRDKSGPTLDEKDVEEVFKILSSIKRKKQSDQSGDTTQSTPRAPKSDETKVEEINKIKRLVRDSFSTSQRKALWRALSVPITEAQISKNDINAVFKNATDERSTPSSVTGKARNAAGQIYSGLKKQNIDVSDLQQAWKNAGYPDDTRDIEKILIDHGFSKGEIKRVYSNIFQDGGIDHEDDEVSSPAVEKIAKFIRDNGYADTIKSFLETEFGKDIGTDKSSWFSNKIDTFKKKFTTENVRQVFVDIIKEERTDRMLRIKNIDKSQLGRSRK